LPDALAAERMRGSFRRGDLAAWPYDDAYARDACDPATLLPGARSVVCVALSYSHAPPDAPPGTGRVSNYAWGADYHTVLRGILERVCAAAQADGGQTRIVCDTAAFAERAFAERAGLGWAGKHTNLIVPGAGSFVFLGEAITTLELEPDLPLRKTCGNCTRCVDICPTRALRGDYTIDANRCISDLTQRTGIIPRALRPLIGDWIWGCDLCQEICPPVRRATAAVNGAFAPLRGLARPDLIALLHLGSSDFRRRFGRTAMGWRGSAVLRRNAAIVLGNALERAAVPALQASLATDRNAFVRAHAAWALGRIGSPAALQFLGKSLETEADPRVLEEIREAL
jgi:epoxyqueuosine reductase